MSDRQIAPEGYVNPTQEAINEAKAQWNKLPNTITILQRLNDMAFEYRWGDNIGNYWSPGFDNVVDCIRYASDNGLKIQGGINEEREELCS